MKKIEFKTGKGEFVLVDMVNIDYDIYAINGCTFEKLSDISEITEHQASEVVDEPLFGFHYKDYIFDSTANIAYGAHRLDTAIDSLNSLIKSKGIYLYENPLGNFKVYKKNFKGHEMFYSNYIAKWQDSEQKTFYNPYIFKKI